MIHWHALRNPDGSKDQYAIAGSVDGVDRYTVARIGAGEHVHYEPWVGRCMLGQRDTAADARSVCEMHVACKPLAHRHDPVTSVQAAARHIASGKAERHIQTLAAAVRSTPGETNGELAARTGIDYHEIARRAPEAAERGLIHRAEVGGEPLKRLCNVRGTAMTTWLPGPSPKPLTESQMACLQGSQA